jgi:hypothetical protein
VIFFQGKRMSGKDVVLERCLTKYFENGITCFHAWAARNNENWFYAHNNNCGRKWQVSMKMLRYLSEQKDGISDRKTLMSYLDIKNNEIFDFFVNEFLNEKWIKTKNDKIGITQKGYEITLDEPLHCNCNKAYPITVFLPSYTRISQTSIDNFNKQYFWDYKEYQEAYLKRYVIEVVEKNTNFWKILKPAEMQKELLKVVYFTVPTHTKKDIFVDQFTKYLLGLREEHRIGVQNPRMFNGDDKFRTLAAELNALPNIMTSKHFMRPTTEEIGKPEYQWDKHEKSWDKLCIALGELKTIAPSQKLSGEQKSSDTKRALFDKIGEWRHWKLWFLGSYQNPEDLYSGVRYQADNIAIKRASRNLLGDDFAWLFADIEEKRLKEYRKHGFSEEMLKNRPLEIDNIIHKMVAKKYPRVQNLPDNMTIVTDIDNSWYYLRIPENEHHHKHTKESFENVFKLEWKIVDEGTGKEKKGIDLAEEKDTDEINEDSAQKKKNKQDFLEKIDYMHNTQVKTFPQIAEEMTGSEEWKKSTDKEKKNLIKKIWTAYDRFKEKQVKDLEK